MSNLTDEQYASIIKYYRKNPSNFVTEIMGFDLTEQQKRIFNKFPKALAEGKNIAVKAGHSFI